MSKLIDEKCPYLKTVHEVNLVMPQIREDFELQYNDEHIVERVKVGETDIDKEVASHVNEVGLVNVFKNAIAHGEDPMTKFVKVDSGSTFSVDPNATMDDLLALSDQNKAKLSEIATQFGLTADQLVDAVKSGNLDKIVKSKEEPVNESGGDL